MKYYTNVGFKCKKVNSDITQENAHWPPIFFLVLSFVM